ncbi:MAG: FKBP-type peptidyl-prolyl cis-trans isomerase [Lachnospiraceae bacterium]|nr:FKBP-type peptidyl-prolyl cis-trans isomerase [Lachnospiraceae bacterium]
MMANNSSDNISASKRKRLEAEAQRKKAKQEAFRLRLTGILIGLALLAVIVFWLVVPNAKNAYIKSHLTEPSDDFSALLNEDGTIQDVDVTKTVTVFDPAEAIVEVTEVNEADVQTDIDNQLNSHKTLETDKKLTVKDGDQINLDYVGKIDGKAFDGGSTEGAGTDLTIGSGSYIDNFEEQLIGSHPGDKVTVKVTFPEDYQSEDLAGKEAEFDCTVNGIYSVPEFNDKFVEENLADFAEGYKNTAEEYRRYLTDTKFDQNLESALKTYISDNVKANSYPKEYLQRTKEITRYMDEQSYAQMVSLYQQMGYPNPYADFYAYAEAKDDVDYERVLEAKAKDTVRDDMAYQLFYQNGGLTISDDDYTAYLESTGMTEETNGKGYIMQQLMHDKVIDDLKTKVGTKTVPAEDAAAAATGATAAAAE